MEDEVYFELKIFLNFTLDLRLEVDRSDVAQERQLWFRLMSDVCERCGHAGKPPAGGAQEPCRKRRQDLQDLLRIYMFILKASCKSCLQLPSLQILHDVVEHHLPHVLQQQWIRHAMPRLRIQHQLKLLP